MRPVFISKALTALDRDGVCQAQTTAGAGNLLINGALASGGSVTLATQRRIGVYSAADLSSLTFTVYGTDLNGNALTEAITGPTAGATVGTTLDFLTVTRVAVSGAVGTNVEVGTTGVASTQPVILDNNITPFSAVASCEILSGSANFTIQYTPDDVFTSTFATTTSAVWFNTTVAGATANADVTLPAPVAAVRLLINSGTTPSVRFTVRQAG